MNEETYPNEMRELAKVARRAYQRKWYSENREKARMYQDKWIIKKARELGLIPNEEATK